MDLPEESLINGLKLNVLHSIIGSEGQIRYQLIGFFKHTDLSNLARRWAAWKPEELRQPWRKSLQVMVCLFLQETFSDSLERFENCSDSDTDFENPLQ